MTDAADDQVTHDACVYILDAVHKISAPAQRLAFLGVIETFVGSLENMYSVSVVQERVGNRATKTAGKRRGWPRGKPRKAKNGGAQVAAAPS